MKTISGRIALLDLINSIKKIIANLKADIKMSIHLLLNSMIFTILLYSNPMGTILKPIMSQNLPES